MSTPTYTITMRDHGYEISYSVSWWREATYRRTGWRPDKRVTGSVRGPEAAEARMYLRELLERR